MKIGLLGFGAMGKTHFWCVNNLKYFYSPMDIQASYGGVCTSHIETAKKAADFLGIDKYTVNEDDLINDPDIDIIDICTPNIYHYETIQVQEISVHDFPGDSVAETLCSQCRGPGFEPWSGNQMPHATTKGSHATIKGPRVPQLGSGTGK